MDKVDKSAINIAWSTNLQRFQKSRLFTTRERENSARLKRTTIAFVVRIRSARRTLHYQGPHPYWLHWLWYDRLIIQPIQGFTFHPSSHLAYPEQVLSLLCCNCNSLGVYATCWYRWRKWNHLCFEMQRWFLCAMCQRRHSINVYCMSLTAKMKPTWCQMMVMIMILNRKS